MHPPLYYINRLPLRAPSKPHQPFPETDQRHSHNQSRQTDLAHEHGCVSAETRPYQLELAQLLELVTMHLTTDRSNVKTQDPHPILTEDPTLNLLGEQQQPIANLKLLKKLEHPHSFLKNLKINNRSTKRPDNPISDPNVHERTNDLGKFPQYLEEQRTDHLQTHNDVQVILHEIRRFFQERKAAVNDFEDQIRERPNGVTDIVNVIKLDKN